MLQVSLRLVESALLDFHVGLRLMKIRYCLVEVRLGGGLPGKKFLDARGVHFRELERGLRAGQIAFGLRDRSLKQYGIDLRNQLARFHVRIKIHEQLLDVA